MFYCRKIGRFSVSDSDPLHSRRATERQMRMFLDVIATRQKTAQAANDIPISEVYRRATKVCPSISINPRRQQGRPCISGTSIPVHLVLWAVEQHGSIEGALKSYPDLSAAQVKDALYFAEIVMGSTDMESANVLTETTLTA